MTALVFADAINRGFDRPVTPPTRPIPITAAPLAALAAPAEQTEPVAEKGVSVHA